MAFRGTTSDLNVDQELTEQEGTYELLIFYSKKLHLYHKDILANYLTGNEQQRKGETLQTRGNR